MDDHFAGMLARPASRPRIQQQLFPQTSATVSGPTTGRTFPTRPDRDAGVGTRSGPGPGHRSERRADASMGRRRTDVERIDIEGVDGGPLGHDHAELRAGMLRRALDDLRDDLAFDTATVFVRARFGWSLLERRGPLHPWHAVLDPG